MKIQSTIGVLLLSLMSAGASANSNSALPDSMAYIRSGSYSYDAVDLNGKKLDFVTPDEDACARQAVEAFAKAARETEIFKIWPARAVRLKLVVGEPRSMVELPLMVSVSYAEWVERDTPNPYFQAEYRIVAGFHSKRTTGTRCELEPASFTAKRMNRWKEQITRKDRDERGQDHSGVVKALDEIDSIQTAYDKAQTEERDRSAHKDPLAQTVDSPVPATVTVDQTQAAANSIR